MEAPSSERMKLFVGGISSETGEEVLKRYFSAYGEIREVMVVRDRETKRGKGFAFVQFMEAGSADAALRVERHVIGDRTVEVNRAKPRGEQNQRHGYLNQNSNQGRGPNRNITSNNNNDFVSNNNHRENGNSLLNNNEGSQNKIFVGGLPDTLTEEDFRSYFENFGRVTDAAVIYDNITRRPRGFGFITFDSAESSQTVLQNSFHQLNGKSVEVKIAVPKQSRRQSNGSHNNNYTSRNNGWQNGFEGSQGAFHPAYSQYMFYHGYPLPFYYPYHYTGYTTGSYGGYGYAIPSSSPWRGQGSAVLSHNVLPYGNTAPYPGDTNSGNDNTIGMTTGDYSVVASPTENNIGENETGVCTNGGHSMVANLIENNLEESETDKQTVGGYSVDNSNKTNVDDGETDKQITSKYIVAANSIENNLEKDEVDKQTHGESIMVVNSCENNLEEGDIGKQVTSVDGITKS